MKRNEACVLLTAIAPSEFIDEFYSRETYIARDICVCSPNKILNVLARDEEREHYATVTVQNLQRMLDTSMLNETVTGQIEQLKDALQNGFEDGCGECFLTQRCEKCPNYRGA